MSSDSFKKTLTAVIELKRDRIVTDYAIGGAMAMTFWSEPTTTFDLDIFVLLPSAESLISRAPIYRWAEKHGYPAKAEHIIISGVPVQFIPAYSALVEEAVTTPADLDYEELSIRVIRPEYLVAMSLEGSARTAKRLLRVSVLLEENIVDRELLHKLLTRYSLELPMQ